MVTATLHFILYATLSFPLSKLKSEVYFPRTFALMVSARGSSRLWRSEKRTLDAMKDGLELPGNSLMVP